MREISILKVLPEGRAVVAAEGRFRVVVAETGVIIDELVSERRSQSLVASYNERHRLIPAVAVPYSELVGPCEPVDD